MLINLDDIAPPKDISAGFDVRLLGKCDDVTAFLAEVLQWDLSVCVRDRLKSGGLLQCGILHTTQTCDDASLVRTAAGGVAADMEEHKSAPLPPLRRGLSAPQCAARPSLSPPTDLGVGCRVLRCRSVEQEAIGPFLTKEIVTNGTTETFKQPKPLLPLTYCATAPRVYLVDRNRILTSRRTSTRKSYDVCDTEQGVKRKAEALRVNDCVMALQCRFQKAQSMKLASRKVGRPKKEVIPLDSNGITVTDNSR